MSCLQWKAKYAADALARYVRERAMADAGRIFSVRPVTTRTEDDICPCTT